MAITKASTLGDTLPTIIEEARFTEQFANPMAALVWNIKKKLHDGSTVNVPYFGIATAQVLTEGLDMASPTTMVDTNVPITPVEVGCQILVTDKLVRDNQEDIIRAAGKILGDAMGKKRDEDLCGQMDDATNSLGGTATLTLGHIAAGNAILSGVALASGGPAPQPRVVVHHPYCLLDIVDIFTPTIPGGTTPLAGVGAGSIAEEVLRNYYVGRILGMNVYEDGNIDTTTIANTAKGGIFASGRFGSIILATALEWDVKPEYDASLRATELNIVGEYGVGEYLAGWIVELDNDATLPA